MQTLHVRYHREGNFVLFNLKKSLPKSTGAKKVMHVFLIVYFYVNIQPKILIKNHNIQFDYSFICTDKHL